MRTSQVRTCEVKLGQVKSSQGWSSLVKTGQVKLDHVKLSQDMSSQVGIGLVRQLKSNLMEEHLQ